MIMRETDEKIGAKYVVGEKCRFRDSICKYTTEVKQWIVAKMQEMEGNPNLEVLEAFFDCKNFEETDEWRCKKAEMYESEN